MTFILMVLIKIRYPEKISYMVHIYLQGKHDENFNL